MRNSRGMASRVPGSSLPTDAFEDSLEALVEHVSLATSGGSRSSSSNSGGYLDSFSPADTGFQGLPMPAPPLPAAPPPRAAAMTSAPSADIHPGDYGVLVGSPSGQHLQIDIISTWGDPHYVGLSALELFDELVCVGNFPDAVTYTTLIDACGRAGHLDQAFALFSR